MMRVLFWLLLLVNLLFFAYMQWGNTLFGTNVDLQAQPPLNPEKIRLLPSQAGPSAISAPVVVATSAPVASPQPAPTPPAEPAAIIKVGALQTAPLGGIISAQRVAKLSLSQDNE